MLSVESVIKIPIFGDLTYGSVARQNDEISPRETNPIPTTVKFVHPIVNDLSFVTLYLVFSQKTIPGLIKM